MKVGDFVQLKDEDVEGRITGISSLGVEIVTGEGFQFTFQPHDLIVLPANPALAVSHEDIARAKSQKQERRGKPKVSRRHKGTVPPIEIDLHIEKLVDSDRGMTSFDILNLQIETARYRLEHAIRNRIPRLVFIHGVGEGVLKMELETLFGRYDHIEVSEADPRKYGYGATEVYISQKAK
jgi:hypothetical protein